MVSQVKKFMNDENRICHGVLAQMSISGQYSHAVSPARAEAGTTRHAVKTSSLTNLIK